MPTKVVVGRKTMKGHRAGSSLVVRKGPAVVDLPAQAASWSFFVKAKTLAEDLMSLNEPRRARHQGISFRARLILEALKALRRPAMGGEHGALPARPGR